MLKSTPFAAELYQLMYSDVDIRMYANSVPLRSSRDNTYHVSDCQLPPECTLLFKYLHAEPRFSSGVQIDLFVAMRGIHQSKLPVMSTSFYELPNVTEGSATTNYRSTLQNIVMRFPSLISTVSTIGKSGNDERDLRSPSDDTTGSTNERVLYSSCRHKLLKNHLSTAYLQYKKTAPAARQNPRKIARTRQFNGLMDARVRFLLREKTHTCYILGMIHTILCKKSLDTSECTWDSCFRTCIAKIAIEATLDEDLSRLVFHKTARLSTRNPHNTSKRRKAPAHWAQALSRSTFAKLELMYEVLQKKAQSGSRKYFPIYRKKHRLQTRKITTVRNAYSSARKKVTFDEFTTVREFHKHGSASECIRERKESTKR